jgi:hypothetical protein
MKHALFAQEWVKDERLRHLFYQDAFYLCILFVRWNFACWYSNEEDFKMLYFCILFEYKLYQKIVAISLVLFYLVKKWRVLV